MMKDITVINICPFCFENKIREPLLTTEEQAKKSIAECPTHGTMDLGDYLSGQRSSPILFFGQGRQ